MQVNDLTIKYGNKIIFNNFSFEVLEGKITCILGASGCGKTTLLKAIAGVIPGIDSKYNGEFSVVFQEPRLLPHLSAIDNLALVMSGTKKAARIKAKQLLVDMQLSDAELLYPAQLSGGMAQRVSIARALAADKKMILMDEPFKGLDLALQNSMIEYFVKYWNACKKTTIYVTHSILEALLVADRIIVLSAEKSGTIISYQKDICTPRNERQLDDGEIDSIRKELHGILTKATIE